MPVNNMIAPVEFVSSLVAVMTFVNVLHILCNEVPIRHVFNCEDSSNLCDLGSDSDGLVDWRRVTRLEMCNVGASQNGPPFLRLI